MKTCLKTIVLSALSTLVAFSGLTYSSCNPDPCKAITCAYGGVCKDGECLCTTGYEGVQCEKVMRDKFLGTWAVTEIGTQSGPATGYPVSIEPAQAIQDVVLKGMYNGFFHNGVLIEARVNNDTLYIAGQYHLGKYVEGIGYINPNTSREEQAQMILRYYVEDSVSHVVNDFGWDEGQPSIWYKNGL